MAVLTHVLAARHLRDCYKGNAQSFASDSLGRQMLLLVSCTKLCILPEGMTQQAPCCSDPQQESIGHEAEVPAKALIWHYVGRQMRKHLMAHGGPKISRVSSGNY